MIDWIHILQPFAMNYAEWITALLRLPIRIYLQHYVELFLVFLALLMYRNLKKLRLRIIIPLLSFALFLDLLAQNHIIQVPINVEKCLSLITIFLAIALLPALKKFKLQAIIPLLCIMWITGVIGDHYASKGWYNLFVTNFDYLVSSPLIYILYYQMLRLNDKQSNVFCGLAIASMSFFIVDYVTNTEVKLNYRSLIICNFQQVIMSWVVIYRLVTSQGNVNKITDEPYFWICAGRIVVALVSLIYYGLHPYMVENFIEVYKRDELTVLIRLGFIFAAICNFLAVFLCGKRYPDSRLSFSKPFQNKAPRY
jgi:hypothetical protein